MNELDKIVSQLDFSFFGCFRPGEVQPIKNRPARNAIWLAVQLVLEL